METAPEPSTSAAPAAAPAPSTSEHTPAAAASMPPQVSVNANGTPGAAPVVAPTTTGKWTDSFDADSKDYIAQKGFQDPKAILESYRNLEKLRGVPQERLLKLPDSPDAPEWNDVYSKLGMPATTEGYGLQAKDSADPAFTEWAKDTFLKNKLTVAQGQELVKQFSEFEANRAAEANAQHTAKVQEQTAALRKEWGAAFQQNLNRAQAAFRQFGIPGKAVDSLEKTIGFDGVMKLFNTLGSKIGEHSYVGGENAQNFGEGVVLTPEQANARIKALKQDNDWIKRYLAKDVKAVSEMSRLMQMAHPTD